MTTILWPDETGNVDFAESRHKRDQDRVACFLRQKAAAEKEKTDLNK
jgi:hypothetical protein